MNRLITCALAVTMFLVLLPSRLAADWTEIDNFNSLTNGLLNGQNGWRGAALIAVGADPENPDNKVSVHAGGTTTRGSYKSAVIDDGTTGTVFFRFRAATDNADPTTPVLNWSAGMTDSPLTTNEAVFNDFEPQLNQNRDAGAVFDAVRIRDAGAFTTLTKLYPNSWYSFWLVIDNAADTTKVYIQGGQYPLPVLLTDPTGTKSLFKFRNSGTGTVASNLVHFLVMLNSTHRGTLWFDDVYLDSTGENLTNPVDPGPNAPVVITQQPTPAELTVNERTPVTFIGGVTGTPPIYYQWQRSDGLGGFTNIDGATFSYYSIPITTPLDNGLQYRFTATNSFSSVVSDPATLTVISDTIPPVATLLRLEYPFDRFLVSYSEPMDPDSATDINNYLLPDATIVSATQNRGSNVILRTAAPLSLGATYTLSINNVKDQAFVGNSVTTNLTMNVPVLVNGYARAEYYTNLTIANAVALTNDARFPYFYDTVVLRTTFESQSAFADTYGMRIWGLFIPPTNGLYSFYLRSDDQSLLFMNTNAVDSENPDAKRLIAYVNGANQWWTSNAFQRVTVDLIGGQRYYIEGLLREGTGGDYIRVQLRGGGSPAPTDGTSGVIPASMLAAYVDTKIDITQQPLTTELIQNRTLNLSVTARSSFALTYQWYFGDNAIEGATNATYSIRNTDFANAGTYSVLVSNPFSFVTSDAAVVSVTQDIEPPKVLSAGSLDGLTVGIIFDEFVDPALAQDAGLYVVYPEDGSGVVLPAEPPTLRPDGHSITFPLALPIQGKFYVEVLATLDLAQNLDNNAQYVTNRVLGYTPQDLGAVSLLGTNFVGGPVIELMASGADIWTTADQGYVALRPVNGDFDTRVRVTGLLAANVWSKAGLMARVSANANSANVFMGMAPPDGQNTHTFQWRMVDGDTSYSLNRGTAGANAVQTRRPAYPVWLRLTREGSVFSGFISTNGTAWDLFYSTNTALFPGGAFPATLQVGLAATAHTSAAGPLTTATFEDLQLNVKPVISDAKFDGGLFQVSFETVVGFNYVVEYKNSLADEQWQTLPPVAGDGNLMTVFDPDPASPTRFYRVRVAE